MTGKDFAVLIVFLFLITCIYVLLINPLIENIKMAKEARKNLSAKPEYYIQKHYDSPTEHICIGDRVIVVFYRPMPDGRNIRRSTRDVR